MNPNNTKAYCDELLKMASATHSDRIFAEAYYYLMEYYIEQKDIKNTLSCAIEGMKYQERSAAYDLAAKSYYYLGVYTEYSGNSTHSVEYFLRSIDFCRKYNFKELLYKAANSLATTFRKFNNYEKALEYYVIAGDSCPEHDSYDHWTNEYLATFCNRGYCLIALGKLDDARILCSKLEEYVDYSIKAGKTYPVFVVHTFMATMAHALNDEDSMEKNINMAKDDLSSVKDYFTNLNDIYAFLTLHKELDRMQVYSEVLDHYITRCVIEHAPFEITKILLKKGIQCALATADNPKYISYSRLYFDQCDLDNEKKADMAAFIENAHVENSKLQNNKIKEAP